jgi:flagellar basal-body rod protein FlgC
MKKYLLMLLGGVMVVGTLTPCYSQTLDGALDGSVSGMIAQKIRLGIIAENVSNVSTFKVEETGEAYRRQYVVLEPYRTGVRVKSIEKSKEPLLNYSDGAVPQSSAENGFEQLPNVSVADEMINMSYTEVMYEANVTCFKATKAMYQSTIDTLK